jgi:hypothetical protein
MNRASGVVLVLGAVPAAALEPPGDTREMIVEPNRGAAGWEGSAGLLWESRYLSEGRDNLGGGSLVSTRLEAAVADLRGSLWLAQGADSAYQEQQLTVGYGRSCGDLEWEVAAGLVRLPAAELDHELGVRVAWALAARFEAHWHLYYSAEAAGIYQLVEVVSPGWGTGWLDISLKLGGGFNGGYVVDGHRGLDHLCAGAEARVAMDANWELSVSCAVGFPLGRDPDNHPGDLALFDGGQLGIGVRAKF